MLHTKDGFRAGRPVRLSDNAVDLIEEMILTEELLPGAKLPGERELAAELGVSRTAVRDAMRILEGKGLLAIQPGRGTYVVQNPNDMAWVPQWAAWLAQHKDQVVQIMEVRCCFEVLGVRLAAERATEQQLQSMAQALDRMEEAVQRSDMTGVVEGHQAFEQLLVEASGNDLIVLLRQMLYQTLHGRTRTLLRLRGITDWSKEVVLHRNILDVVRRRDSELAATVMERHLKRTTALLLEVSQMTEPEESSPA